MKWSTLFLLTVTTAAGAAPATGGAAAPSVTLGPGGRLAYARDARGNAVPDFSNCGYRGGGVALPGDVPVKITLRPQAAGDDGDRIQAAIDGVGKMPADARGVRGAVLLARGTYRIAGSVRLDHGGVVLRGEGEAEDGTVLVAVGKDRRALIQAGGSGRGEADDEEETGTKRPSRAERDRKVAPGRRITDAYVPVGSRSVTLDDASGLKAGDEVDVHRPSTENWIHELGMDRLPPRKDGGKVVQWTAGSKDLHFDRVITAVEGNRVTFDAPLANSFDADFGGGDVKPYAGPARAREIGVENLRGVCGYEGAADADEEHAWTFISYSGVQDGYVRHVTSLHFANNCVALGGESKWVTVQDCTCLDPVSKITGGRRYSFAMSRCQLCLVQRCRARNGRHDFVMGSLVAGPNVFLDCSAEKAHADAGPHHRWSVGTLYDNLDLPDGELNLRNRGNLGSGHGWAGANQVCWNCRVKSMVVENPPTARNWAIGCTVKDRRGDGAWESVNEAVKPRSLYLAQLKERLGEQAVRNAAGE